jgi:small conductance mechanosensitive channel
MEFNALIDYAADVEKAVQVAQEVANADPRVLKVPPPVAAVGGVGEETVNIIVRASVRNADYDQPQLDLQKAVKQAFDRAKIPSK